MIRVEEGCADVLRIIMREIQQTEVSRQSFVNVMWPCYSALWAFPDACFPRLD